MISSRCFPELAVNFQIPNKAIRPRLTNLILSPLAYLLPVAACNTTRFNSS